MALITEKDLREAIAECQGQRNPNANTCIKLAAYLTILNSMRTEEPQVYSYSPALGVELDSGTEFASLALGRDPGEVLEIMDELMTALSVYNPRLYAATIRKLEE